jgi:hypothetical protein
MSADPESLNQTPEDAVPRHVSSWQQVDWDPLFGDIQAPGSAFNGYTAEQRLAMWDAMDSEERKAEALLLGTVAVVADPPVRHTRNVTVGNGWSDRLPDRTPLSAPARPASRPRRKGAATQSEPVSFSYQRRGLDLYEMLRDDQWSTDIHFDALKNALPTLKRSDFVLAQNAVRAMFWFLEDYPVAQEMKMKSTLLNYLIAAANRTNQQIDQNLILEYNS